jgi:predicted nucleotidyltransferase
MNLSPVDLQAIRAFFADKPVLRAYLFGSYARGEADENSDVDLLVELDYSQPIGLGFIGMKLDLEERLGRRVDLVSSQGFSPRLLPYIEPQKTLVYERANG